VFAEDPTKKTQWSAFVRKTGAKDVESLAIAISDLVRFLEIPIRIARDPSQAMRPVWRRGGPWSS
jgi:hypothetical protein